MHYVKHFEKPDVYIYGLNKMNFFFFFKSKKILKQVHRNKYTHYPKDTYQLLRAVNAQDFIIY